MSFNNGAKISTKVKSIILAKVVSSQMMHNQMHISRNAKKKNENQLPKDRKISIHKSWKKNTHFALHAKQKYISIHMSGKKV